MTTYGLEWAKKQKLYYFRGLTLFLMLWNKAKLEAIRRQLKQNNMDDDRILTKAKSALKLAHIIRYENGHEIIDVSLLRTIQDPELMKFRNVGKATIEKIREIRKSLQWV